MGENREAITALLAIRQRAGISPLSDWKVFRFDYCCFTSALLLLSYWFAPPQRLEGASIRFMPSLNRGETDLICTQTLIAKKQLRFTQSLDKEEADRAEALSLRAPLTGPHSSRGSWQQGAVRRIHRVVKQ